MNIYDEAQIQFSLPAIEGAVKGDTVASGPIIMSSAAGWYVGQVCLEREVHPFLMPYDRMSMYYRSPTEPGLVREWEQSHAGWWDKDDYPLVGLDTALDMIKLRRTGKHG